jgi:hypothetical protein
MSTIRSIRRLLLALLAISSAVSSRADDSAAPRIELRDRASLDVLGLSPSELTAFEKLDAAQQSAVFRVFVDAGLDDPPPIAGKLAVERGAIRCTLRYPLERGVRYRAIFDRSKLAGGASDDAITAAFAIEKPAARPTVVDTIYPTAGVLPENQLKFYLHFSAPMSRGEAYRHVHLVDLTANEEVDAPFLELGEELWDGDFRRFTLLCDPGRVKRGLKPREELGAVLQEGHRYALVVDKDWRDATRTPLAAGARKEFSVGPPDDEPIDPASWKIEPPAAGGADPLVVRFGEPLDRALVERIVWVADGSGEKLPGAIRTADHESTWHFTPQDPWRAGRYQLVAETTLEDLAGNAIGRPFEVDEVKPIHERIETKAVSLPFSVAR